MAIAKKGTRLITVDHTEYRWIVQSSKKFRLDIIVECANVPGQRMVTGVDCGTIVSPWLVKAAIQYALEHGWQPQQQGKELICAVYGRLEHSQDWAEAHKASQRQDVVLSEWNPSPALLRRWAYEEHLHLDGCEPDLVLHKAEYLPILIPIAADPDCPKAADIVQTFDYYLRSLIFEREDTAPLVIQEAITIAESVEHATLADWVSLLKRLQRYCQGVGAVNQTTALAMGDDLLNGLDRGRRELAILAETQTQFQIGFTVNPSPSCQTWLTIDKTTGQFSYHRV